MDLLGGGAQPERRRGSAGRSPIGRAPHGRLSGEHRTDLLGGGAQPERGSGEHRTDLLTLASRSPQRRAILEQLGIDFRVVVPEIEELTGDDPEAMVIENARRKARSVAGDLVLGVDTAVVVGGLVIGKPADEAQARSFLSGLSGKSHEVWSGIALIRGRRERTAASVTRVRFRALDRADLDWYLATREWRERAGGYAIQARGAALVEAIEGDYLNVVGLPVAELVRLAPELVRGG